MKKWLGLLLLVSSSGLAAEFPTANIQTPKKYTPRISALSYPINSLLFVGLGRRQESATVVAAGLAERCPMPPGGPAHILSMVTEFGVKAGLRF